MDWVSVATTILCPRPILNHYEDHVCAGALGRMIGVYVGRPLEGWTYERIMAELGEITDHVNDRLPWIPRLIVTDDDLAGTFTFLRALPDYGNSRDLTPAQSGQTWLHPVKVYLYYLTWDGEPEVVLARPVKVGMAPWKPPPVWRRACVDGVDQWEPWWKEAYRIVQNTGRGLIIQGTREWPD